MRGVGKEMNTYWTGHDAGIRRVASQGDCPWFAAGTATCCEGGGDEQRHGEEGHQGREDNLTHWCRSFKMSSCLMNMGYG